MAVQEKQGGQCAWNSAFCRHQAPSWVWQEKGVQSLKLFCGLIPGWSREIPRFLPFLTVLQAGNGSSHLSPGAISLQLSHVHGFLLHSWWPPPEVALQHPPYNDGVSGKDAPRFAVPPSSSTHASSGVEHSPHCPIRGSCAMYLLCHSDNQYHIQSWLVHRCLGAFGVLWCFKGKVFKHVDPKWKWKLKSSAWTLCI